VEAYGRTAAGNRAELTTGSRADAPPEETSRRSFTRFVDDNIWIFGRCAATIAGSAGRSSIV
jgi:hypothetical protein